MKTIDELKHELDSRGSFNDIKNISGIYKIYLPKDFNFIISEKTDAITEYYKKGKKINLLYLKEKLNNKWQQSRNIKIDDMILLYVGKAQDSNERGLRRRVKELVMYGYGLCDNHRGGRAIWQIENNKKLFIEIIECENSQVIEKEILKTVKNDYNVYPFANWRL